MIKRFIPLSVLVVLMMVLTVSVASAAQGQITEVNPSGIGVAIQASDGQVRGGLASNPQGPFLSESLGAGEAP
jgi:hypothetical protein